MRTIFFTLLAAAALGGCAYYGPPYAGYGYPAGYSGGYGYAYPSVNFGIYGSSWGDGGHGHGWHGGEHYRR